MNQQGHASGLEPFHINSASTQWPCCSTSFSSKLQQQHFVTEQLNERQALLSGRVTTALVASMPQSQLHVVTGRIQPSPMFGTNLPQNPKTQALPCRRHAQLNLGQACCFA
jgi:hypothetical protein